MSFLSKWVMAQSQNFLWKVLWKVSLLKKLPFCIHYSPQNADFLTLWTVSKYFLWLGEHIWTTVVVWSKMSLMINVEKGISFLEIWETYGLPVTWFFQWYLWNASWKIKELQFLNKIFKLALNFYITNNFLWICKWCRYICEKIDPITLWTYSTWTKL